MEEIVFLLFWQTFGGKKINLLVSTLREFNLGWLEDWYFCGLSIAPQCFLMLTVYPYSIPPCGLGLVIDIVVNFHKKEICEAVTIIETRPLVVVGVVGYAKTPCGLCTVHAVWAQHLREEVKRRFYQNWCKYKKRLSPGIRKNKKKETEEGKKDIESQLGKLKKYATYIRVLAHTHIRKLKGLKPRKAHLMEIQVNVGTVAQKVNFAYGFFEKHIPVDAVFQKDEMIDIIGVTKGKGYEGVVTRWGVTCLQRKTHKALRKVACIGAYHARAGQNGYHK
ncbi:60S ribosomal protein L3-1-like [Abrus precatorius]|uniref:60S ribosomal protein L3-1-like n=1 Tax=Abrus precatorius TaxID=3816 RepID=A0A8B8L195_ABRPR|nr:60S ribosomal protein L3-1-like [Abrus precatorius]